MGAEILLKTNTVEYIQCKCHSAEKIQIDFILANFRKDKPNGPRPNLQESET